MTLGEQVSLLMRDVAASVVMPRFRALVPGQIAEKSPGEVVTVADREAEARLHDRLAALGLGARIVGEEAAEQDPMLLEGIGKGLVWLIDPLDGTANFAAGRAPFGMMIALVDGGEPLESWILDPQSGRLCHARRGAGASCDGKPVTARRSHRSPPRAALGSHFLPPERRAQLHDFAAPGLDITPVPRCAAESYVRLVLGQDDIALFQRILPWDHAAGALFLTEAGGKITHWDGTPYRIGGRGRGVLAAANAELWQTAAELVLHPAAGLTDDKDDF
ncbi:fructose-1,6-bisphosphatase/inositol monophosphatase family enzyme [Sphingopyxis panaciterrae]|uniref:inositol monophosphatase family protein n=1 Tax=Sphingopyxis panaciterrae TaxID=363841 RepID=UPI001FBBAE67|nr:inositol monophosphatase family protein [Sphingopyxis panaciterrae]NIJ36035.1 fructose-1,6-bisphosphatase/inositol monophosphatase family enzyme [Sphingopyxis panaciterrae]